MLNVAIVGCGKIADEHAHQILRMPNCRLAAVCDAEPLMAMQMHERFGGVEYFDSVDALLSRAHPDVIHITTPPQSHYAIGRKCIEAGCHVYVEKPFALNLAETAKLIDLAEARHVKLTVGHNLQFTNVAIRMRELIGAGYVGSVAHVESYYGYNLGDAAYARAFLNDRHHWVRQLPGGLFQNIISHGIGRIAEFLKSDSPRVVAHAFTSTFLRDLGETGIQDELRVIIADDATTAYFTFSTQIKPQMSVLRVYGNRNGLAVDDLQHTLVKLKGAKHKSYLETVLSPLSTGSQFLRGAGANVRDFVTQRLHMSEGMRCLIEKFYRAIADDGPLPIPYREIVLTARIMDDIFAQAGAVVDDSASARGVDEMRAHESVSAK